MLSVVMLSVIMLNVSKFTAENFYKIGALFLLIYILTVCGRPLINPTLFANIKNKLEQRKGHLQQFFTTLINSVP